MALSLTVGSAPLSSEVVSVWDSRGGNFADDREWVPAGVPSAETPLRIEGGEVLWEEREAFDLSRAALTVVDGGDLLLRGTFRNGVGAPAELRIESGGILHEGNFFVLGFDAPGTIRQSGGFLMSNVATGFYFSDHRGGAVDYQLDGGEVRIVYSEREVYEDRWQAFMGKAQNDRWTINGGLVEIDAGNAGFDGVREGTREFPAYRSLSIRRSSRLELNGGEVTFRNAERLVVGEATPGDALLTVNGGKLKVLETAGASGGIAVGVAGEGVMVVNDGKILVTVAAPTGTRKTGLLVGSDGGYGSLEINGGVVDLAGLDLEIARGESSVGQVRMMGGALRVADIRPGSPSATARFRFGGGLIVLSGDRRSILGEPFFTSDGPVTASYDRVADETRLSLEFD